MNKQKKPLYFYYLLILIVIVAGNMLFSAMEQSRIKDVSYNTFIKQTEQKKIDKVEIGDQSISYTLKKDEKTIYQTETMETDTALSQRLYDAGATFTRVHAKEMNPWLSFLITGILPIILLFWFGNHMFKKMQKKMGGDAMSFGGGGLGGFGKSDAKIYVKSQTGKTFLDVAGQEEAKAALQEMVEFLESLPALYPDRCTDAKGSSACRASGYREDTACESGGRGSKCTVFLNQRFGICRDVCRARSCQSP